MRENYYNITLWIYGISDFGHTLSLSLSREGKGEQQQQQQKHS